ncbi:hypothetical protein [Paenibacillus beijingensis]|uniref:hypothetical protein n=1 Tax=Paenibacillus beijingensis TaxID=1126833 RepID=UPI0006960964|nr:hypothetical protein [Paenibacillus beijingensis]
MSHQPFPKSKALTVLFSMMFPGGGHLYLGQMARGLSFMILFVFNIALIVFADGASFKIGDALVVFFGLMLPVTYLLNIFDGLQKVNENNYYARHGAQGVSPFPETNESVHTYNRTY